MLKKNFVLLFILITNALLSTSYATEKISQEFSIYLGDSINLKEYINNKQLDFDWTDNTVIHNLNASVLFVNSSNVVKGKSVGTGVLVIANNEKRIEIKIEIITPVEEVLLDSQYVALLLGEIYDLEYTVKTTDGYEGEIDDDLHWVSSKPKVASIGNNKQVITKSTGNVIITGHTVDDSVVATLEISVIGHSNNLSVTSKDRTRHLNVGETLNLSAFFGTKNVTDSIKWISLTPHVLKVDEMGVVTAIGQGHGEIKVQSSISHKYASYELDSYSMIDRVELNNTSIKFNGLEQTHQLSINLYPKDKSFPPIFNGYKYTTSNSSVATVSENGLITSKGQGIALISVVFDDSQKRASCTVEVLTSDVLSNYNYKAVDSMMFTSDPGMSLIGEKIPLSVDVYPSDASNQDIEFNIPNGSNSQIHVIDGHYYFIPEKRGSIRIEAVLEGIRESITVPVTSPIESLDLSLSTHRVIGTNEEQLYIGEKAELLTRIYTNGEYSKTDVFPSSLIYKVENEDVAKIITNGSRHYLLGLKKGKTEVTVENLEGLHEATLWISIENPLVSISTDDEVILPFNLAYRLRVNTNFISLSKPVSDSFDIYKILDLNVNKLYLHEDFVTDEISYEEREILRYSNMPYDLSTRDVIDLHQSRLEILKKYQSSIENHYILMEDLYELKNRNGRNYDFYKIDKGRISSNYPIKALLEIEIDGTAFKTQSSITFTDDVSKFSIKRLGTWYNKETLMMQYGIYDLLKSDLPDRCVKLLVTYMNHMETIKKSPTYDLLSALYEIDQNGFILPNYDNLEASVTKADLAKIGVELHKKYIDRFLNFDNVHYYYYDVLDDEIKDAISLNYIRSEDINIFGVNSEVTLQEYYSILNKIVETAGDKQYNNTRKLTVEALIIELGKLL